MYILSSFLAGVAIVGFERTTQDNGNSLAIREGETLELCVALLSGTLPFQIQFQTFTDNVEARRKRQATSMDVEPINSNNFYYNHN